MNFVKSFKLFESRLTEYDTLMGQMLHLYGSIPLPKEKSSVVIRNIVLNTNKKFYKLGEDVNISHTAPHDKVRFKDYFDSLLKSKDSRGFNFEGTLAGLFDGKLSSRGAKWDITIDNKTWSVKFVDLPSKAPEIGSFRAALEENNLIYQVDDAEGLTKLFKGSDTNLKNQAFSVVSRGITGGWIIAYPIKTKNGYNIVINIIDLATMKDLLVNRGLSVSPKAGLKSKYTLALSAKYKGHPNVIKSTIIVPRLKLEELRKLNRSSDENEWANSVFGDLGSKIRPDVLRYIRNNPEEVANRLLKFKEF